MSYFSAMTEGKIRARDRKHVFFSYAPDRDDQANSIIKRLSVRFA